MEILLRPETAERIRRALGEDVDLSPSAVPSALARLSVEASAIYSEVLAEISGTQIRLDSERALAQKRRSAAWRRVLFSWGEYQSDAGDHLIAKRHVAAAVPLGLAGLLLLGLAGSALLGHRPPAASVHASAAPRSSEAGSRRTRPVTATVTPSVLLPTVPPLPSGMSSPSWDLAAGIPPMPQPGVSLSGNPLVFIFDSAQPSRDRAAPPSAAGTATPLAAAGSPIVYERPPETTSAAGAGPAGPTSTAEPDAEKVLWTMGLRVSARLATGIVVASGGPPTPVLAETADPAATWLGQATLGIDGRVQVAFALAGAKNAAHGVALDPVHLTPGLTGRTTLRQAAVAAAALSAATQAAASYARALAQQGQTAIAGDWSQWAWGQPGPAWTYLASSLADSIAPPSRVPGPIETSEVAAGAPIVILVTEVH